ncbi:methyltransferase [Amycolatopsis vancoresmycina]|uniref:Putative O-methyltransferase n=1 Tax=Amycolatopsis vancoresmycina DSM 44592 TaxID=1292037 RepID=R1FX33_9PSEU|nr:methyltransferase [Amycolatopsis vancoresmycina]EOD63897.1 putative O-methyltransferase [Amycolatopsis vancoresmycina DSM 44592]
MDQSILALADLATPMAIRVAATLGLADHEGTAAELASATGASPAALARLLDHLVTAGVFAFESGRYRPTDLGAQLRTEAAKVLLDINRAGGRADLAFADLLGTITTGEPAYERRYGRGFWADIDAEPRLRRSFDAQMGWRFRDHAPRIAGRFAWSRFPRIVDVGGGDGVLLAEILRAHPEVRGEVLDLAPSATAAAERFAAAGFGDRASAVAGSFFDPLPPAADAYVLSDILHDWDDDHAARILTRCREAADPSGTVVVIEPLHEAAGTAMDLFMLMCFGGRERTPAELETLAADSGLVLRETVAVSDGRTALEFGVAGREW